MILSVQMNGDSDDDCWSGVVEEPKENGSKCDETVGKARLLYDINVSSIMVLCSLNSLEYTREDAQLVTNLQQTCSKSAATTC